MLSKSFKPAKCKTALNLGKARIKLMKNKKDVQIKQLRRDVALLLQNKQDQTARIRVEHVVREEKMLAAYEMIEIYCELVVARLPIIESQKKCPLDLKEAIASLIFAAPRCGDIQELQDIRKHFTAKYGKEFAAAAIDLHPSCGVSRTLVEKLSVQAPDGPTKVKILKGIAEENNFQWEPDWFKDEEPLPLGDMPQKLHVDDNNSMRMEPLNVQIGDVLQEKHAHVTENLESSSQRHPRTNVGEIPPSPSSRPDTRTSGNISEGMFSSQSSSAAETMFSEFKDATSAANAAAASAEQARMAAKAAAEFATRDSDQRGQDEQRNQVNSSFNRRSVKTEGHKGTTNQQSEISGKREKRNEKNEYRQSEVQDDTRQKDLRESESTSYPESRHSKSSPSTSRGDYNWSNSSNTQQHEPEPEPVENPFHEETVNVQNQSNIFHSNSSGSEDEYDAFSILKHQSAEIYSESSFNPFDHGIPETENWQAKSTYVSNSNSFNNEPNFEDYTQRNVFKKSGEKNYDTGVFDSMDQGSTGLDFDDKIDENVAYAVFDETDSDIGEYVIDPVEDSLSCENNPYSEHGLSASFRSSSLYSKLIEPLPIPFDDDEDVPSPKTEETTQKKITKPETGDKNYRTPDWDSHATIGYLRSVGEKENHNLLVSPQKDRSVAYDETHSGSDEGMELNLRALPTGRRKKPTWPTSPYTRDGFSGDSSPSSKAKVKDDFDDSRNLEAVTPPRYSDISDRSNSERVHENVHKSREKTPKGYFESDGSVSEDYIPVPVISKNLQNARISRRNLEAVTPPRYSDISNRSNSESVHENVHKSRGKTPKGYFEFDGSVSEDDDVPVPVITKTLQNARISRRTLEAVTPPRYSDISDRSYSESVHENVHKSRGKTPKGYFEFDGSDSEDDDVPVPVITKNLRNARISRRTKGTKKTEDCPKPGQSSRNDDAPYENPETPKAAEIPRVLISTKKAPSRENSGKSPSHVHPKLPDFEEFTAHFKSLRKNRQ